MANYPPFVPREVPNHILANRRNKTAIGMTKTAYRSGHNDRLSHDALSLSVRGTTDRLSGLAWKAQYIRTEPRKRLNDRGRERLARLRARFPNWTPPAPVVPPVRRDVLQAVAVSFIQRSQTLGLKGKRRDDDAITYFCGAAAAFPAESPERNLLAVFISLDLVYRGYVRVLEVSR